MSAGRVIEEDTLIRWARELDIIEDKILEAGLISCAGLLQEIREELPNAGKPFMEVPYA
jgi:hypothetical protein